MTRGRAALVLLLLAGCNNLLGFGDPGLAVDAGSETSPDGGCESGTTASCFEGPGQPDVGQCEFGLTTCGEDGVWGACEGQVSPSVELCSAALDENCDSMATCTGVLGTAFTTTGGRFRNLGVDSQAAIYTLGDYSDSYEISGTTLPDGERGEISLVKQAADRSVLWAKSIASLGIQSPQALLVKPDGTFFVAGLYSSDASEQFMIGTRRLTAVNVTDPQTFVAQFDENGDPLWAVTVKASNEYAQTDTASLALGGDGSLYWLQSNYQSQYGSFDGPVPSGSPTQLAPQSALRLIHLGNDGHLIDYSSYAWPTAVEARGITLDSSGDIYLALNNQGASFTIGSTPVVTVPVGGSVVKLDAAYTPLQAIALSSAPTKLVYAPSGSLYASGEAPTFVQEVNANGTLGWSVSTSGAAGQSVAVDAAGYVVVTGFCTAPVDLNPSGAGGNVTGSGACVAKYDDNGAFQWGFATAIGNVVAADVAVTALGEILIAGDYAPTANLGTGALAGSGGFVLPLSP